MQWNMQVDSITYNQKVKLYFTLPEISATKIVTWKWHVDESAKGRYSVILGRDILTALGLNIEFSVNVIKADDGTLKDSTALMVDMGTY